MSAITFQVDVSRTYRNKEGYKVGPGRLNTSFKTEPHTPESFLDSVIRQGWPYTMVHLKRSPQETGAAARNVKTPKHTENFISRQDLTGDIDNKQARPGVIAQWLHDSFFRQYGWAFVESVNSIPGQVEKGHPTLIFDRPITCAKLWKECMQAWIWKHPDLDRAVAHADLTVYNAQNARVHLLGNICPFEVFEREVLIPYREDLAQQGAIEAEYQKQRQAEREKAKGKAKQDAGAIEDYLTRTLDGIFDFVASQRDNRHGGILWAGKKVGGLEAAEWSQPFSHLFDDVENRIILASESNGYMTHPNGGKAEILRTFADGRTRGESSPADEPVLYERATVEAKAADPTPEVIAELERIGAEARAELEQHDQRSIELGELGGRLQKNLEAMHDARRGRVTPKYDLATIDFETDYPGTGDEYYKSVIVPGRKGFSSARDWRDHVRLFYPDLDADHEYKIKRQEQRERAAGFCGKPIYYPNVDGTIRVEHACCGVCERCKQLYKDNLKQAIAEVIADNEDLCLTLVVAHNKKERSRIVRGLKSRKCFPVQDEEDGIFYHILYPGLPRDGHRGDRNNAIVLDIVDVTDDLLTAWVSTPDDCRASGNLFGNFRKLRKLYGLKDEFEKEPGPGTKEIELPGIIVDDRLKPEFATIAAEVTTLDELQAALWDIHLLTVNELRQRRGDNVILCIVTKKKHYALNDEKVICELFNTANEARRRKKRPGKA